jgi:hypothetical protein
VAPPLPPVVSDPLIRSDAALRSACSSAPFRKRQIVNFTSLRQCPMLHSLTTRSAGPKKKSTHFWPRLNERSRRMVLATEAAQLNYGGVSQVRRACGMSGMTITKSIRRTDRRTGTGRTHSASRSGSPKSVEAGSRLVTSIGVLSLTVHVGRSSIGPALDL